MAKCACSARGVEKTQKMDFVTGDGKMKTIRLLQLYALDEVKFYGNIKSCPQDAPDATDDELTQNKPGEEGNGSSICLDTTIPRQEQFD